MDTRRDSAVAAVRVAPAHRRPRLAARNTRERTGDPLIHLSGPAAGPHFGPAADLKPHSIARAGLGFKQPIYRLNHPAE